MQGERTPNLDRKFPIRDRYPSGRRGCRVCGKECPPRCSSYCSADCRAAAAPYWSIATMRAVVFERDNYKCCDCGMDIAKLYRILEYVGEHPSRYSAFRVPIVRDWLKGLRFDLHAYELYHIDHITPVCEGGLCEPDNLRTLCHTCHKKETKEMHRRRKLNAPFDWRRPGAIAALRNQGRK